MVVGKGTQVVVPRAHIAIDYTLHRFIHAENIKFFYRIEQSTNQKEQNKSSTFIVLVTSHVYACAGPRLNSVGRLHEKTMT